MDTELLKRITVDSRICHGKPVIRNSRYMVESILEYMAGGDSIDDIIVNFPDLDRNDILACLAFAARTMQLKDLEIPAA